MKYQIEEAESCIVSQDFQSALNIYKKLNERYGSEPYLILRLAFCYRMVKDLDRAIMNYSKAIELGSDDNVAYWSRGACYNDKAFINGAAKQERSELLSKALADYKYSIELEPTSQEPWLAMLEIDLWLFNFDDAISHYGQCKPFIQSKEYCLIRSWYGCLALAFSGDSIEDDDELHLLDMSIRLKWFHWIVFSVDQFFTELEQMNFDDEKLQIGKKIHERFLMHFDDEPFNPNAEL